MHTAAHVINRRCKDNMGPSREEMISKLKSKGYDVLVIGGGITGTCVARDSVLRGFTTACVDKNDWAFGTSSRSSKMIHGGIRYLEMFEFHLVFEACRERRQLLLNAPHLVYPLSLIHISEPTRLG